MTLASPTSAAFIGLIRFIAVTAAVIIGVTTAIINARFGYGLGEDPLAKAALMVFAVAVDIFKWTAPILAGYAWRERAWLKMLAALALWLVAGAFSMAAAVGFSATNRDTTQAERITALGSANRAVAGHARATATLDTLLKSPRWNATRGCTEATTTASQTYCDEIKAAKAELRRYEEGLAHARPAGSVDPQAAFFAGLLAIDLTRTQQALTVSLAITAEVFSMLGLFVALPSPRKASGKPAQHVFDPEPPLDPKPPPKPLQRPSQSVEPPPAPVPSQDRKPLVVSGGWSVKSRDIAR